MIIVPVVMNNASVMFKSNGRDQSVKGTGGAGFMCGPEGLLIPVIAFALATNSGARSTLVMVISLTSIC
jgi:hypothetical protein